MGEGVKQPRVKSPAKIIDVHPDYVRVQEIDTGMFYTFENRAVNRVNPEDRIVNLTGYICWHLSEYASICYFTRE